MIAMASQAKRTRRTLDEIVAHLKHPDNEDIPESDDGGLSSGEESFIDEQLLDSDPEWRYSA